MPSATTIIGAGPAGSIAAIVLARAGWQVTLVEQHRFPRDKVCGECVSALGIDVLTRLRLIAALRSLGPTKLTRSVLVAPDGSSASVDLPRPMWGLSRSALDDALLGEARAAGATIEQPARCEDVDVERPRVVIRDLLTNCTREIRSDYVIIADGKAGCSLAPPPRTTDLGVKAHFADVDDRPDAIALFGLDGHYVGLAPIEGNRWNLCMSVPAARVRALRADLDALFEQCVRENRGLASRMRRARRIGPWLSSPLPRHAVRKHWQPRIIPIGNAAAALEPIGGEGIGLAMRSAELAAASLASSRRISPDDFDRLWRVRSIACRAMSKLLSSPMLAGDVIDAMRANDHLNHLAMGWMGKS